MDFKRRYRSMSVMYEVLNTISTIVPQQWFFFFKAICWMICIVRAHFQEFYHFQEVYHLYT